MNDTPDPEHEKLLQWSRQGFRHCDRQALEQAARLLDVNAPPRLRDETLRARLCQAIGLVEGTLPPAPDATPPPAEKPAPRLSDPPPNLAPSGRWGGRYRRLRLMRGEAHKDHIAFPVSWEGQLRYFHFETELDMPWPYFSALQSMKEVHIQQHLVDNGKRVKRSEVARQGISFSDLGDTPGTQHLPRSMVEYVRWLALANDRLGGAARRDLIRIMRWLHGQSVNRLIKDLSDEDLRDTILSFIGVDIYADAA